MLPTSASWSRMAGDLSASVWERTVAAPGGKSAQMDFNLGAIASECMPKQNQNRQTAANAYCWVGKLCFLASKEGV